MVLLLGGSLTNGEAAPMESFCLVRNSEYVLDSYCEIDISRTYLYSEYFNLMANLVHVFASKLNQREAFATL